MIILSLFLLFIIFGLAALSAVLKELTKTKTHSYPHSYSYRSIKALLTDTEVLFYKELLNFLPADNGVSLKVRLSDIIESDESDYKKRYAGFNKIKSKHIDFVIYNKENFTVKFLIELDDKTHFNAKNAKNDSVKNAALANAGIKLYRIFAKSNYEEDLAKIFTQVPEKLISNAPSFNAEL